MSTGCNAIWHAHRSGCNFKPCYGVLDLLLGHSVALVHALPCQAGKLHRSLRPAVIQLLVLSCLQIP